MDCEKISKAVEDCLSLCRGSFYPLGEVAAYVSRLENDPKWQCYEIEAVELRVLRMLSAIVTVSNRQATIRPR